MERMRARAPSAEAIGPARLAGMQLTLDKRGRDGSGKANLVAQESAHVWGVVYSIERAHWLALDVCESDYRRIQVSVEAASGIIAAETYVSSLRTVDPVAHTWYKQLIVEGARAHGLPAAYCALLDALPARDAPD